MRRFIRLDGTGTEFDQLYKGRTNVIGAMYYQQPLTITIFNACVGADIFSAWRVHDLIPKLPPQAVVVMDNAAFHKPQDIPQALLKAGHTLE